MTEVELHAAGPHFPRHGASLRGGLGYGAWLALLLAGLLAWRLVALTINGTDLFFDEAQYWAWSRELDFGYYSKPPVIAWVIRAATEICGIDDSCIRAPSSIIHTATAALVFLLGRRLYSAHVGFWSALAYATLPGVSASSSIISTDVPLLFFWALALYAYLRLLDAPAAAWGILLGIALGLGLNAKYAMAYFIPCVIAYAAVSSRGRAVLLTPWPYLALAIAALLIAPNALWNLNHGGATLAHTAENANWQGSMFNPGKLAEFVLSQFGVFGPVLFAAYLVILWRTLRIPGDDTTKLLLAFSLPILATVTVLAFLSRAHPNWAALSYVAAVILVTAVMFSDGSLRAYRASFVLHGFLILALAGGGWAAGRIASPLVDAPFGRMLGWEKMSDVVAAELDRAAADGRPYKAVLAYTRDVTAELIYYLRDRQEPVLAWRNSRKPRDHFELTRPYRAATGSPVLLVSSGAPSATILQRFERFETLAPVTVTSGGTSRQVVMTALSGLVPPKRNSKAKPAKTAPTARPAAKPKPVQPAQ